MAKKTLQQLILERIPGQMHNVISKENLIDRLSYAEELKNSISHLAGRSEKRLQRILELPYPEFLQWVRVLIDHLRVKVQKRIKAHLSPKREVEMVKVAAFEVHRLMLMKKHTGIEQIEVCKQILEKIRIKGKNDYPAEKLSNNVSQLRSQGLIK